MNSLYIGIGTALIIALVTALIGPFFVDWGAHRVAFETQAARIVGLPVRVLGDVDARLLPSPRIRFGDVVVGALDRPVVRIGRFELDVEVAPLIKGEVRVGDLRLDRPEIALALGDDGRLVGLDTAAPEIAAAVERLEIVEGRLTLSDARSGTALHLERITARGSAASLMGPWKLDGRAVREGQGFTFHLGAGREASGETSLRLSGAAEDAPLSAAIDLKFGGDGRAPINGTVTAERRPAAGGGFGAWRLSAGVAGAAEGLDFTDMVVALGAEEREARVTGSGRVTRGAAPSFEVRLASRQIDLDRLTSAEGKAVGGPGQVLGDLLAGVAGPRERWPAGRVRLDLQGAVIGGALVQDIALEARTRPGGVMLERFSARAPGRTVVTASGRLDLAEAPEFVGHAEIVSDQPGVAAAWWGGAAGSGEAFDAVSIAGDFVWSATERRGEGLRLAIGRSQARGWFDWAAARGPRLGLTSERLELDQAVRLARLLGDGAIGVPGLGAEAIEIDLDAETLVLPGTTARKVGIGARASRERVEIRRLEIGDLAGARLTGSGRIEDPLGAPKGEVTLDVAAERPAPAARALAGLIAPGTEETAAEIGRAAGPLAATLRLSGTAIDGGASEVRLAAHGRSGGQAFGLDGQFVGRLDAARVAKIKLAGQFGAAGVPSARLALEGTAGDGLTITASGATAEGKGQIDGRMVVAASGRPSFEGRIAATLDDASALAAPAGRPIAAFERRLPLAFTAKVRAAPERIEVAEATGTIDGVALTASGGLDLAARPMKLSGRLRLDRLGAGTLADLVLGGGAAETDEGHGAVWSAVALEAPLLGTALAADVGVEIGRLEIGEATGLDAVSARVIATAGETRLDDLSAGLAGGRLGGAVRIAHAAGAPVAVSGRFVVSDVDLARGTGLGGLVAGEATFSTSGRTTAGLVAGLAGQGRAEVRGGALRQVSPDGFAATVKLGRGEAAPDEAAVAGAFTAAVGAGWAFGAAEVPFTIEAGVARAARAVVEGGGGRLTGRGAIDLTALTVEAEGSFEPMGDVASALETPVSHARPSVGLRLSGGLAAAEPTIDASVLAAHIALDRVEQEIVGAERARAAGEAAVERDRAEAARRLEEARRAAADAAVRRAAEEVARAKAAEAAAKASARPVPSAAPLDIRPPQARPVP